jgi:YidC/Oxa1 family membrane protein insertase
MEKRVLVAIVLCVGILVVWQLIFPGHPPQAPVATPGVAGAAGQVSGQAGGLSGQGASAGAVPGAGTPAAAAGGAPAPSVEPERQTVLAGAVQRFVFSNRGASLRHAELLEPKFQIGEPGNHQHKRPLDLVRTTDPRLAPLRISFPDAKFPVPADTAWRVAAESRDEVTYRAESGPLEIEKRFRIDATRYRVHMDVTVKNRSAAAVDHHLALHLTGRQDPGGKGSFFSGPSVNTASLLCHYGEKTERVGIESLAEKGFPQQVGAIDWVASDEKFFLTAAAPYPEPLGNGQAQRTCKGQVPEQAPGPDLGEVTLSFAERSLAPGAKTQYAFAVFIGPKVIEDLEAVRPGGQDINLTEAVDVTLAVLSRPMLTLLKIFHRVVGNWGVAIILLTVFIRIITFYPTQRSLLSAKKMQKLAPKMAAIRKKYENDRQRQSVETMNLYKAHGVSPFGGCLPSLIQMPIWIALYSTLNYAVELYRSPFMFHIHDLTAKDPYYITPLIMGGVMFVQMKMSPTSPDAKQQAMMAVMMPVMFTAFSLVLPSGLAVYMLTSYLIGILQQLWVNHLDRKASPPVRS